MSKIDEIKLKYTNIRSSTFEKFLNADNTPTKKYFEYYVKCWANKQLTQCPTNIQILIETVTRFDKLIEYLDNKDIYSKEYKLFPNLLQKVDEAEIIKLEKTFVKEEHVQVLFENDDYICLIPKTHMGSLKYGSNTKWCTASRKDKHVFDSYTRDGLLVYLIDKKKNKENSYNKIAFYHSYDKDNGFGDNIHIYDEVDRLKREESLISAKWDIEFIIQITSMFRFLYFKRKSAYNTKKQIDSVVDILSKIDFIHFNENLKKLEDLTDDSYILGVKDKVDEFLNNVKESQCKLNAQKLI
jgi:hypothetical protein